MRIVEPPLPLVDDDNPIVLALADALLEQELFPYSTDPLRVEILTNALSHLEGFYVRQPWHSSMTIPEFSEWEMLCAI